MIDELEFLREARPETPHPDPILVLRARRALLRRTLVKRSRRFLVRGLAGVVAAAAVLAVVGVVNINNTSGGAMAVASILKQSADRLDSLPAPKPGQYLYVRSVETNWNIGVPPTGPAKPEQDGVTSTVVETWIPGDESRSPVERLTGGDGKVFTTPASTDGVPSLYDDYPEEPTELLSSLRVLANERGNGDGTEAIWRTAFRLVLDPLAPQELKADVLRALAELKEVKVLDREVEIAGRIGTALGLDIDYAPQLVFDPTSGESLGSRGSPERGPGWVGPGEPRYTVCLESKIVDSAPEL